MPPRPFRLSTDLLVCTDVLPCAFQYPENPAWDMQVDEQEDLVGTLVNLARVWPLIKLVQTAFPTLRDYVRGYVWEEEGKPVGVILLHRESNTSTWDIMGVGVLPRYRRRGIGRSLVDASLGLIRERGGRVVLLDVIAGNAPAYKLYEQLGFESFERRVAFDCSPDVSPPEILEPGGYATSRIGLADWRSDYGLALLTIPVDVQKYRPVQETRYRLTLPEYLATRIAYRAGGTRKERVAVHTSSGGEIVAVAEYSARTRPGGVNRIHIRVDPTHAVIAPYLLCNQIRAVQALSPGRRTTFTVPHWQRAVIEAAYSAGCAKRLEYHRMGMILQPA